MTSNIVFASGTLRLEKILMFVSYDFFAYLIFCFSAFNLSGRRIFVLKSHFLRISRIERHSRKIQFFLFREKRKLKTAAGKFERWRQVIYNFPRQRVAGGKRQAAN